MTCTSTEKKETEKKLVLRKHTRAEQSQELRQLPVDRLQDLLSASPAVIYISEATDNYDTTYISQNVFDQLGYTAGDFIENPGFWEEHIHPEDRPRILDDLSSLFEYGKHSYEYRFLNQDGIYRWMRDDMRLIRNSENNPVEIIGSWTDITDRKQAEQELRESETRFRAAFEQAAVGIAHVARDGKFLLLNQRFCDILGYSQEEMLTFTFQDITHPDDLETDLEYVHHILADKIQTKSIEKRFLKKNGSAVWVNLTVSLVSEVSGQANYYMAVMVDITRQKQSEAALKENQHMVNAIVESSRDWIWSFDLNGKHTYSNHAIEKILGYSSGEIQGKGLEYLHPVDRKVVDTKMQEWMALKQGWQNLVLRWRHKDGTYRFLESTAVPNINSENELIGFRGVDRDITDRKQAQEQLSASESEMRALFNAMPASVIVFDRQGRLLKIAPTKTNCLFLPPKDILGKTVHDILPEATADLIVDTIQKTLVSGKAQQCEYNQQNDGIEIWFSASSSMLNEDSVVWVAQDISSIIQAERSLDQKTEELSRLYRASETLLTSISANMDLLAKSIVGIISSEYENITCSLLLKQSEFKDLDRIAIAGSDVQEITYEGLSLDGPGLVPEAIRSGNIINIPDVTKVPKYIPNCEKTRSELVIPLKLNHKVTGAIDLQSTDLEAFTSDDERWMKSFAEQVVLILENNILLSRAERRLKNLRALHNIDIAIAGSLNLTVTLSVFLEQVISQLEVDAAAVLLMDSHLQCLEYAAGKGFRTEALQNTTLRIGEGYAGFAALERQPVNIPDLSQVENGFLRSPHFMMEGFIAYSAIPLIAKGNIKGVLEVFHRSKIRANSEWSDLLSTLSGTAAIAIDNASLFVGMQKASQELDLAYLATLEGWARALELRDMETEGHSKRVVNLTLQLAKAMGLSDQEQVHIHRGALLHDIGKMGIPDTVLLKPGKLTDDEWKIMRQHPTLAYEMLSQIRFLRPALDIPHYHHERWDGSGYPEGLKGEQIPLAARIFAIVDVWDAMTSDRPYRKAVPEKAVIAHIIEQSGKHFDPIVVEAYLQLIDKKED